MNAADCPFGCPAWTAVCVRCGYEHSWCLDAQELSDLAEAGWDGEMFTDEAWLCSDCLDAEAADAARGGQMALL